MKRVTKRELHARKLRLVHRDDRLLILERPPHKRLVSVDGRRYYLQMPFMQFIILDGTQLFVTWTQEPYLRPDQYLYTARLPNTDWNGWICLGNHFDPIYLKPLDFIDEYWRTEFVDASHWIFRTWDEATREGDSHKEIWESLKLGHEKHTVTVRMGFPVRSFLPKARTRFSIKSLKTRRRKYEPSNAV